MQGRREDVVEGCEEREDFMSLELSRGSTLATNLLQDEGPLHHQVAPSPLPSQLPTPYHCTHCPHRCPLPTFFPTIGLICCYTFHRHGKLIYTEHPPAISNHKCR